MEPADAKFKKLRFEEELAFLAKSNKQLNDKQKMYQADYFMNTLKPLRDQAKFEEFGMYERSALQFF